MKTFLRLAIFSWAALAATAFAQDFDKKISFESTGGTAKQVLKDIGKAAGLTLETAPQTANEVLVIRVKDVTVGDLMKKIAQVTSGVWQQEGEIYRLVADNPKRNAEAQAERTARIKAIKEAIDKLLKGEPKPSASGQVIAGGGGAVMTMGALGSGGAEGEAIKSLLPMLDAATLADIPDDGRMVFSSNPTRMQRPFSRNVGQIIDKLVVEHNKMVDQMKKAEDETTKTEQQIQAEKFARDMGLMPDSRKIEGPASKLLLVAARQQFMDGITLQLKLFDQQGRVAAQGMQNITIRGGAFDFEEIISSQTKPAPPPDPKDEEVKFSQTSQQLQDFMRGMNPMGGATAKPMPKEVREVLLRPDLHDPLSFIHGEASVYMAKVRDLNLVANLPDDLTSLFSAFATAKVSVNSQYKTLTEGQQTKAEVADGWMVVSPARPNEARIRRADRAALTGFIAIANSKGVPSLDDLAAYAMKANPPMESPGAILHLAMFAPSAMGQGIGGLQSWDMLRLYGTLSQGQKSALINRQPIRFGELTAQQSQIVSRLVFGASARLKIDTGRQEQGGGLLDMARTFMPSAGTDYREEPTEIMPNGLPGDGYITVNAEVGNFVTVATGQNAETSGMFGALGADEIAMFRWMKEDPNFSQFAVGLPNFEQFRVGNRETYTFVFHVAPRVSATHILRNDNMPKDAAAVNYDGLPQAFRDRVDQRVKDFKKNPFPAFGGFGSPPP
jgi:hypothetical protein